jgi:hypothetical protein
MRLALIKRANSNGLVVLHGEQVVGASVEDGGDDLGLAPSSGHSIRLRLTEPWASLAHGIDGDQRALQFETLERQGGWR